MLRGVENSALKSQIHTVDYKNCTVDFVNCTMDYKNHSVDLRFQCTVFNSFQHRYFHLFKFLQVQLAKLELYNSSLNFLLSKVGQEDKGFIP